MKIFLTGGTGYIGCKLIKELNSSEHEIFQINRSLIKKNQHNLFKYDGTISSLQNAIKFIMPDMIIHLASMVTNSPDSSQLEEFVDSNLKLPSQLLEVMKENGLRKIIVMSTAWQNYEINNQYTLSKQYQEDLLKFYSNNYGIEGISLRIPDVYGPDDSRPKIINLLKSSQNIKNKLEMSKGEQELDLLYIDDVIDGLQLIISESQNYFNGFNIYSLSSLKPIKLKLLVQLIENKISKKPLNVSLGLKEYRPNEIMKIKKPKNLLHNWKPKTDLLSGLIKTFDE